MKFKTFIERYNKRVSVFDFDDTLITLKDRSRKKQDNYYDDPETLHPDKWQEIHEPGPALEIAKNRSGEIFILTARFSDDVMRKAIHEFLKSQEINIPIDNIVMIGYYNMAEDKAAFLKELKEKLPVHQIEFYDDSEENVEAANRVGVKATKV